MYLNYLLVLLKIKSLKKILKTLFLLISCNTFWGQIPSYYQSIDLNLSGDLLKNELSNLIINTHQNLIEYTSSNTIDTWDVVKSSDVFALDTSKVMLVYGYDDNDATVENDRTRSKSLSCHSSSCFGLWNREHVFPKSLASPNLTTNNPGPGTDVHNLRACDYSTNASRSNKKYNIGSGNSGATNQGDWYPGDEWKGDVARIIMFMYLRYPNQCEPISVGEGTQLYSPNGDMPDIFLEWNSDDPVSSFEVLRNNAISTAQGNRNPFIDNPYLATLIWSGPEAENKWNSNVSILSPIHFNLNIYYDYNEKMIHVESSSREEIKSVSLISLKGVKVGDFNGLSYSTSALSNGIYFVKIMSGNNLYSKKISVF